MGTARWLRCLCVQQLDAADTGQSPDGADHVDRVLAQWAREDPELDLSTTVAVVDRLGRLRAYIDRGLDELLDRYGLTRQSWDVLACLRRAGKPYRLTPTEINQAVMRTSGAITHTLHALEYAGLIKRVPNPDDARGRRLVVRVAPEHVANERRMLAALSSDELTVLVSLLRKLLISFERDNPYPHHTSSKRGRRPKRPSPPVV